MCLWWSLTARSKADCCSRRACSARSRSSVSCLVWSATRAALSSLSSARASVEACSATTLSENAGEQHPCSGHLMLAPRASRSSRVATSRTTPSKQLSHKKCDLRGSSSPPSSPPAAAAASATPAASAAPSRSWSWLSFWQATPSRRWRRPASQHTQHEKRSVPSAAAASAAPPSAAAFSASCFRRRCLRRVASVCALMSWYSRFCSCSRWLASWSFWASRAARRASCWRSSSWRRSSSRTSSRSWRRSRLLRSSSNLSRCQRSMACMYGQSPRARYLHPVPLRHGCLRPRGCSRGQSAWGQPARCSQTSGRPAGWPLVHSVLVHAAPPGHGSRTGCSRMHLCNRHRHPRSHSALRPSGCCREHSNTSQSTVQITWRPSGCSNRHSASLQARPISHAAARPGGCG
eukprot:m.291303 g.291303  ORF g.291303 m.291303 type:complete len:405 (+) comp19474_c3_seq10:3836-5050(+)